MTYHNIYLTEKGKNGLNVVLDVIGDVRELMKDYNTDSILNLDTYELLNDKNLDYLAHLIEELYAGNWVIETKR